MAHYLIMMMITLSFIRYLHICILLALISITRFWQMYVKCYSFSEAYTSVELLLHNRPLKNCDVCSTQSQYLAENGQTSKGCNFDIGTRNTV